VPMMETQFRNLCLEIEEPNTGVLHLKGPNIMAGYLRPAKPGVLEKNVFGNLLEKDGYNTGGYCSY